MLREQSEFHGAVKRALLKDGWIIINEPFLIAFGQRRTQADFGAERIITAGQPSDQIAVNVAASLRLPRLDQLERAIGRHVIQETWLDEIEPNRTLYLAISYSDYSALLQDTSTKLLLVDYSLRLIVVDVGLEEVERWVIG
jgi:hypothetical protein